MTDYKEISRLEAAIEAHATELRCALEELAELLQKADEDFTYTTPLGDEATDYEVQEWADQVNEIEQSFWEFE